jgi:hypothetical protein
MYDDVKSISSYAIASTLTCICALVLHEGDDDDFQITWFFVLIHCAFSLLCIINACMQANDRTSAQASEKIERQTLADILVYSIPHCYTSLLLVVRFIDKKNTKNCNKTSI